MTQRIRGLGFGKFIVGFIGVVAMATLITGAVAASTAPSRPSHEQTVLPADPTGTAHATTGLATEEPKSEPSEGPKSMPSGLPTTGPTANPTAVVTCDPAVDKVEDQAEDQAETAEHQSTNPAASMAPEATKAPEASEPPSCKTADVENVENDSQAGDQHDDKTAQPMGSPKAFVGGDEGGTQVGNSGQPGDKSGD